MKTGQERDIPFLGNNDPAITSWDLSKIVILPIPYEATVSYAGGTGKAPSAILEASSQVEFFDDELRVESYGCGIYTARAIDFKGRRDSAAIELIEETACEIVDAGKFPLSIGGEHSITSGLVKAVYKRQPDLHVVHLDAHADMRAEYSGTPWSHASVMRRIDEMGLSHTSVGIRELCQEEYELIRQQKDNYFFAHELAENKNWIDDVIETITGPVYLTVDVDVFDSSIMPHTGTPSPGGLSWYQVTGFIRALMGRREVIGADVVELAPNEHSQSSNFLTAKLVYKIIGYWWNSQARS